MLYFQAKREAYDYFSKRGVVEGELLTQAERKRYVPYLQDSLFSAIVIPKSQTYTLFGVRKVAHHLQEGGDN